MACKIAPSQRLRLLPLEIAQEQGVRKEPGTMVDLKENIRDEVAAISPTMQQRVMQNFQKRLREGLTTRDTTSQKLHSGSEYCN
jgi:hypothetical protein